MESASVCIVGPCKNAAKFLPTVLPKLMTIASWWKTWKIVLYENDSTDGTPDLLHAWKDATPGDIEILHDTNLNERYPHPIVRLAYIRNRLLDSVPPSFDYMLMVDLDDVFVEPPTKEAFESCFDLKTWDVMTANGRHFYYDIWALRVPGRIDYNCWQRYHELTLLHQVPKQQATYQAIECHKEFMASLTQVIPVDSAYNIGILCKVSAIRPCCRFSSGSGGKPICEHVPFQTCLRSHGARILFNPKFYL
jgi:hypothetical protein